MIKLNDQIVQVKSFPNGESYIDLKDLRVKENNEIKFKFQKESEITYLVFLKEHLDEQNVKSSLVLPYIPYSRMDRTESMRVFTLKYFCKLINNLGFQEVTVYEPHSDVSIALLDRVKVKNMTSELTCELLDKLRNEDVYLVYPDAGAAKRYEKQIKYNKVLTANKERDFKTGDIIKLTINGRAEKENFTAIIVDDLCSRGGTFMLTASKLKEMGAGKIYLVVTHCEETILSGDILNSDLIEKVYTTNSIISEGNKKINIREII